MKPSREFTIKILSDEDFDNLPYPDAKGSLGMSVMETKTAYIRKTGVKDLDRGTLEHEFDELMQGVSDHEVNGIRYKKFKDFFRVLLGTIPFVGGPLDSLIFGGSDRRNAQRQQDEYTQSMQQKQVSPVTSAFAPQTQAPLGQEDFNSSLSNLTKNAAAQKNSVMNKFRGRTIEGDSAFSGALANTKASSDAARNTFLEDQKKLGSKFV